MDFQTKINEVMDFLRDNMATKDDLEFLRKEIFAELAVIKARLKDLTDGSEDATKDIMHLKSRITALENQLS